MTEQRTSADAVLTLYGQLARIVAPIDVPRVVPNDPDDDHVIACAVLAGAQLLVSGDHGVLALRAHQGIAIIDSREAIARIEQAAQ